MNARTEFQTILGPDGKPAFVVIPYDVFQRQMRGTATAGRIPNEVVGAMVEGATPMRAWREHLKLTQDEVAGRMGVTQAAYAQIEAGERPRKATVAKVAAAMGLTVEQLAV